MIKKQKSYNLLKKWSMFKDLMSMMTMIKKQNHEKKTDIIYKEKQNENKDERFNNCKYSDGLSGLALA